MIALGSSARDLDDQGVEFDEKAMAARCAKSSIDVYKGLTKAGVPHEIWRYDADHAFANPSSARYDEKSAEDAWGHVRAFLARELRPAE